ncbi:MULTISPECIES: PHP domain-containing protein [Clostridium]|uniref:PHP domain-containing protein n=1 Tax=Clostridium faecium TaxID=2762223 RepID=A0ABR8YMS5_9CLOT|nr:MULTISPECIES: PHP domain-containing protein [Clostridium]MBD8045515.1 PHP domain-containing protein [Clostridium faecium]MDU1348713.1 PHP domain-containing protein [Clostridium argentinense]
MKIDLHSHTTASDGRYSPKKLVDYAIEKKLDILSITDHDTTDGVEEALIYSKKLPITIIPAIELSTIHNKESIHILGYFRDDSYKSSSLQNFLKDMKNFRAARGKKIVENLKKYFNIIIDYNQISNNPIIARPHIAKAIIDAGYNYSFDEIFKKFLSKDSPAYVENKKVSLDEGIQLLKKHNAFVSLAHPILIKKTKVEELISHDFDGIEAYYSINTEYDTAKFINLAHKHNKILTCGSDFHGIYNDSSHGDLGCCSFDDKRCRIFLKSLNLTHI